MGGFYLSLESVDDLILPEYVGGGLNLPSLKSAENLTFTKYVGGDLSLKNLESANNLILPEYVGGGIFLSRLRSTKGLVFPKDFEIKGKIAFGEDLPDKELDDLKSRYPHLADKIKKY